MEAEEEWRWEACRAWAWEELEAEKEWEDLEAEEEEWKAWEVEEEKGITPLSDTEGSTSPSRGSVDGDQLQLPGTGTGLLRLFKYMCT